MKLRSTARCARRTASRARRPRAFGAADKSVSLRVEGQRWGRARRRQLGLGLPEPGTFYVSVAADNFGRNLEADQFDTLLDLQVTGQVIPTPTPTATAKPAATVQSGQTAGLGAGAGRRPGELGITIVLGLALGGLVGFGVRRLRARRSGRGRRGSRRARRSGRRTRARCRTRSRPGRGRTACPAAGVDDRERDRPHRADQRAPGGAEGRRGGRGSRATTKPA